MMKKSKLLRGIAAIALPAAVVAAAVYLGVRFRPALRCPFYALTGLYCPGCGTCRALADVFHGRFAEAFSHNMLLFILGTPALSVYTRICPCVHFHAAAPGVPVPACVAGVRGSGLFFLGAEEHPCVQCSRTVKCPLFNTEI